MNKTTKKKAIGRPTKYRKEMCETMLDLFKGGATVAQPAIQQEGGGSIPTSPQIETRGFTNG